MAILYNFSVWWNVIGVAVIVVHPDRGALPPRELLLRVRAPGQRIRVLRRRDHGAKFWFYVLPLGFLLTMYTITGYDASAHVSEETHGAEDSAPKGLWRSVFYSAIVGWIVLLAITFAIQKSHETEIYKAGFPALTIFTTALSSSAAKAVILISTIGQLFCGMACITSASRMTFAFSRDGAVPGHNLWRRLGTNRTPTWSVLFVVRVRADHHDPGVLPQPPRHAGRVPRGHLDLGDRPLHRLHDPGVPALAPGRRDS